MVKLSTTPSKRELYVEGGGDRNPSLASECRKAFSKLFQKAGIMHRPRVIACGGRRAAYDQFCTALEERKARVWLLVDAEECASSATAFEPWTHVQARHGDGWQRPSDATDDQLHLMNVVMETWLLSDHEALQKVFGANLNTRKLPAQGASLEQTNKSSVFQALNAATASTKTGAYSKGPHSFHVLAEVSPDKLRQLPWANRFLTEMTKP